MRSRVCIVAAACVFGAIAVAITGCSKSAEFSKEELEQLKQAQQGRRTEMPPEGRKMMEDIAAGRMKPGPPPPDVGQPGPKLGPSAPGRPPQGAPSGQR